MEAAKTKRVGIEEWAQAELGPTVGIDFETYYSSSYSVRQMGNWAYCHDPRFEAWAVSVSDGERTCVCAPAEFPWETIAGREWVSHNREFDKAVLERLQTTDRGLQTCRAKPSAWYCSAALCAYLQLPRDLAGAARAVLGIELDKSIRSQAKGRGTGGQLSVESGQLGLELGEASISAEDQEYAACDAEATLGLWNALAAEWPEHERRLYELTCAMGAAGLCIDWEYVEQRRQELDQLVASLAAALPWAPPLSIKQFRAACEAAEVPPPKSTAASAPLFLAWLKKHVDSDAAGWARSMQRIRSANRTAKVLGSMQARRMAVDSGQLAVGRISRTASSRSAELPPLQSYGATRWRGDSAHAESADRMTYELKYFGASTGRWSGGGGLNLQNLNRGAAEGVDLRRAIVAPPGYRLAVVDYSQIESRVLLYLAGDMETLEMFRANPDADAYEIHARATMGWRPAARAQTGERRPQTGDHRPQTADRRQGTSDRSPQTSDRRPQTGERRPQTGDQRPQTADRRPQTGDRRTQTGDQRPQTAERRPGMSGTEERDETLKEYCDRTGSQVRQLAKARVLGLGFGCGWRRFIEVAKVMAGLDLCEEEAERIVQEFRDSNPKIVALWRRLNDACASCDGGHYVLPLPCSQANPELSRHLVYRDVVADDDGIECTVAGERTRVYGGLLAENWTQATARDVLASAWLRCDAAGYRPVLSVHDELVFEVPEASAEEDLRRIVGIMETRMRWAPGLPLRVDGKLCSVYGK